MQGVNLIMDSSFVLEERHIPSESVHLNYFGGILPKKL